MLRQAILTSHATARPAQAVRVPSLTGSRSFPRARYSAFRVQQASASRGQLYVLAAAKTANTIKLIIQGRKLPVTPSIKQYVEEKLLKAAGNYQHIITKIDVTLSARGGDTGTHGKKEQKVEVTLHTQRNGVVRVEDSEETLYAAIDVVCDKVERKLQKVKEIAISKGKWPGRAGAHDNHEDQDYQEYVQEFTYETQVAEQQEAIARQFAELNAEYPAQVMRSKVVDLQPMTVNDAIDAMEAVGHDFYLFCEATTKEVQVVYRRVAGGYGILIPRAHV